MDETELMTDAQDPQGLNFKKEMDWSDTTIRQWAMNIDPKFEAWSKAVEDNDLKMLSEQVFGRKSVRFDKMLADRWEESDHEAVTAHLKRRFMADEALRGRLYGRRFAATLNYLGSTDVAEKSLPQRFFEYLATKGPWVSRVGLMNRLSDLEEGLADAKTRYDSLKSKKQLSTSLGPDRMDLLMGYQSGRIESAQRKLFLAHFKELEGGVLKVPPIYKLGSWMRRLAQVSPKLFRKRSRKGLQVRLSHLSIAHGATKEIFTKEYGPKISSVEFIDLWKTMVKSLGHKKGPVKLLLEVNGRKRLMTLDLNHIDHNRVLSGKEEHGLGKLMQVQKAMSKISAVGGQSPDQLKAQAVSLMKLMEGVDGVDDEKRKLDELSQRIDGLDVRRSSEENPAAKKRLNKEQGLDAQKVTNVADNENGTLQKKQEEAKKLLSKALNKIQNGTIKVGDSVQDRDERHKQKYGDGVAPELVVPFKNKAGSKAGPKVLGSAKKGFWLFPGLKNLFKRRQTYDISALDPASVTVTKFNANVGAGALQLTEASKRSKQKTVSDHGGVVLSQENKDDQQASGNVNYSQLRKSIGAKEPLRIIIPGLSGGREIPPHTSTPGPASVTEFGNDRDVALFQGDKGDQQASGIVNYSQLRKRTLPPLPPKVNKEEEQEVQSQISKDNTERLPQKGAGSGRGSNVAPGIGENPLRHYSLPSMSADQVIPPLSDSNAKDTRRMGRRFEKGGRLSL